MLDDGGGPTWGQRRGPGQLDGQLQTEPCHILSGPLFSQGTISDSHPSVSGVHSLGFCYHSDRISPFCWQDPTPFLWSPPRVLDFTDKWACILTLDIPDEPGWGCLRTWPGNEGFCMCACWTSPSCFGYSKSCLTLRLQDLVRQTAGRDYPSIALQWWAMLLWVSNPYSWPHLQYVTRLTLTQDRTGRHISAPGSVFCGPHVSGTKPSFSFCIEYLFLAPRIKLTNFILFQNGVKKNSQN